jgi:glutamate 5-kinase
MVNIVESLISSKVLPVLNENDVMKTEDLTLGDNDILSAMVAVALGADKLVILTNRNGLYTENPDSPKAKLIENVSDVDFEIERLCAKGQSDLGSGGMLSKVRAAKHAVNAGVEVLVGNGLERGVILSSIKGKFKGKFRGTRFVPRSEGHQGDRGDRSESKRWMMSAKGVGEVIIDEGAVSALGSGKSLLFPGIISFKGDFDRSEIIEIISKSGQAVAYGKVNYSSGEIQKALAVKKQSKEKGRRILDKEVVHRDYMILLRGNLN